MTTDEFTKLLPILLPTAALCALIGWWLRGKKPTPAAPTPVAAKTGSSSNSERQRLRDLEARLRTAESASQTAQAELNTLRSASVSQARYDTLAAELDAARNSAAALDLQLRKSREVQSGLQAQANDAGKKVQARAIALENELAAARTEIQRLKTLSDPNTDGMKRLEGEIETVRTRLRAVEAQLAERNAELNSQKARALSATSRAPRTVASSAAIPGAALNLLGVETTLDLPSPAPSPSSGETTPDHPVATIPAPAPREPAVPAVFSGASAILGKPVHQDDLTVIEGISPRVSELLSNAGFGTWEALAAASTEALEAVLAGADPALAGLYPGNWPEQARLAADGKWFQLKAIQTGLYAGQPPETAPA